MGQQIAISDLQRSRSDFLRRHQKLRKAVKQHNYKGIISSDWNQCLAPCGPFDPIIYSYPDIASDLTILFNEYTGNKISLGTANEKISKLLPGPISIKQMDDYLDKSFTTYKNVVELINWCKRNKILFMINTTGVMGYFQRIFAKGLLPKIPVISANPIIRYPQANTDPPKMYDLHETQDKGENTARALQCFAIPEKKIVIMGDSGGDGPHFAWGKKHKAYLIGSMAKQSLMQYCNKKKIEIDFFFGSSHVNGEKRVEENEMLFDFMELRSVFERIFK